MPETKRGILSLVSSIFDPLDILTPSILEAKLIIQDLWKKNFDYDKSIPEDLLKRWKRLLDNFLGIKNISIPRWIGFIEAEDYKRL